MTKSCSIVHASGMLGSRGWRFLMAIRQIHWNWNSALLRPILRSATISLRQFERGSRLGAPHPGRRTPGPGADHRQVPTPLPWRPVADPVSQAPAFSAGRGGPALRTDGRKCRAVLVPLAAGPGSYANLHAVGVLSPPRSSRCGGHPYGGGASARFERPVCHYCKNKKRVTCFFTTDRNPLPAVLMIGSCPHRRAACAYHRPHLGGRHRQDCLQPMAISA